MGRHRRSGDQAFLHGSVACNARESRSIFSTEEASAVVVGAAERAPPVRRQGMDDHGGRVLNGATTGR